MSTDESPGDRGGSKRRESDVSIAGEVFERLAPLALAMGIDLGVQGEEKARRPVSPVVNVKKPILELAVEVGQILRHEGLYLLNKWPVTIEADGSVEPMTAGRLVSWLPRFAVVSSGKDEDGKPKRVDLQKKRAQDLLDCDMFRQLLPEVTRILPARLPVFTEDGRGVRLLPKGYDAEKGVYVMGDAPEISDWSLEEAVRWLRELLGEFQWGDTGRSLAAQVSGMVGMFVQLLFPVALPVPLYYFNANASGSGKSILAEMCLTPIYGKCLTDDFAEGDEFKKVLATRANAYASYLFLDDVTGFIQSQALNRFIVQPYWSWREMGTHKDKSVSKRCMTLISANQATLSDDLVRRAVIVDLFSTQTARERMDVRNKKKVEEITAEWLAEKGNRGKVLSALWALVKHWAAGGMVKAPQAIPSFVQWTLVVGGIVNEAGFGDAFAPANLKDAGDKWKTEWDTLFAGVVRAFKPGKGGVSVPLPEWCAVAREHGLYVDKLWELETVVAHFAENPRLLPAYEVNSAQTSAWNETERGRLVREQALRYMHPQKQASPWAKILRKRGGQIFEVDGVSYQFADRHTSTSTFVVTELG